MQAIGPYRVPLSSSTVMLKEVLELTPLFPVMFVHSFLCRFEIYELKDRINAKNASFCLSNG
jgi:hypothetical protein